LGRPPKNLLFSLKNQSRKPSNPCPAKNAPLVN
jgi:hypothetical protein